METSTILARNVFFLQKSQACCQRELNNMTCRKIKNKTLSEVTKQNFAEKPKVSKHLRQVHHYRQHKSLKEFIFLGWARNYEKKKIKKTRVTAEDTIGQTNSEGNSGIALGLITPRARFSFTPTDEVTSGKTKMKSTEAEETRGVTHSKRSQYQPFNLRNAAGLATVRWAQQKTKNMKNFLWVSFALCSALPNPLVLRDWRFLKTNHCNLKKVIF